MRLKVALQHTWRPPTSFTWHQRLVEREVERLTRQLGADGLATPPKADLDATLVRVSDVWGRTRALHDLERRERSLLPHVLFYPPGEEGRWLAADERFAQVFLEWLVGNSRGLRETAFTVLRDYPARLPTFAGLRRGFETRLMDATDARGEFWRAKQGRYKLFSDDGPAHVASLLCEDTVPSDDLLTDAALDGVLATGGFMREVNGALLTRVDELLRARVADSWLKKPLEALTLGGTTLRFEDRASEVANALFLPHAQITPHESTRRALHQFAMTYLDDPRVRPTKWHGAPVAKEIFLQWLVGATLEQFFRIISKSAKDSHWRFRRKFWGAYLKRGLIQDAWVVLGNQAREDARAALRPEERRFGLLTGSSDKSVLLMRVSGLTIAEWSHEAPCFVWPDGTRSAPRLHEREYHSSDVRASREELARGVCHDQWHRGSETYGWQRRLAEHIRSQVGAYVPPSEYQV